MTPTAATPAKLKPGQKRRYIARVRDLEGDHPKHGDDWFRVTTRSNPEGEFATRAWAQDALDRAKANYRHGKLAGHVDDVVVTAEPTLATIKIDDWLLGDVKPIASVPAKYRAQYRDTLQRAALAAYRYGQPIWVNESFRTEAEQQRFYEIYLAGGPLAARPGKSPHEHGLALDIPNVRHNKPLLRELKKLQLIDDVASEIWHVTNHHRV
jgi:hypothetical protein